MTYEDVKRAITNVLNNLKKNINVMRDRETMKKD